MPKDDRTYITVHDGLPEHPKVVGLSPSAKWSLIELWTYCSRTRSDGRVPKDWAKQLGKQVLAALEKRGLIESVGDNWHCHDYLLHQRSKAEIQDLKEKRREAGSRGGKQRVANLQANAQASAEARSKQASSKVQPESETDTYTETDKEQLLAPAARNGSAARKPDELFDALVEACGVNPAELTTSFRGSVNKALKDLRAVDATPGQVKVRAQRFRKRYESISLTPSALAKHWPALGETNPRPATGFTNHGAGW